MCAVLFSLCFLQYLKHYKLKLEKFYLIPLKSVPLQPVQWLLAAKPPSTFPVARSLCPSGFAYTWCDGE